MNKTSYRTRLSYATSDVAGQLVFTFIIGGYLAKFFTDVYGLSAITTGFILAIARWIDAVDAPVWGIVFEKTHSRLGRSRPWFLWLCVPFAVFGVLTFQTPNIGYTAKVWYASVTYIVCSVLYTGINTPVTSILSGLTSNPQERVVLTCFRMLGSKLGVLIVNLTALRVVATLGRGDDRKGFMLTLPIYATASVILYLIAFLNLKETVKEEKKSQSIRESFRAIKGNWPWLIIVASSFCFWIGFLSRIQAMPYFFQYALHRKDLTWLAYSLDFVSLGTAFLLPWFCRWTSKRNIWAIGLLGMVIGQLILYLGVHNFPGHDVTIYYWPGYSVTLPPVLFIGWTFGFLASGMAMAMPFSVLSDSVDFGEWKNGIRAAGLLTAIGAAFCLKAGAGLGGAIPLWIMGASGYVPNAVQSESSLRGIETGFIWVPALFLGLSIIPVLFYQKYERMEPQIQADLARRRAVANASRGNSSVE